MEQTLSLHSVNNTVNAPHNFLRRPGVMASTVTTVGTMTGTAALAMSQAPWWVVAVLAGTGLLAAMVLGVLRIMFPQESQDRLKWWQSLWQHQEKAVPPHTAVSRAARCPQRCRHQIARRRPGPPGWGGDPELAATERYLPLWLLARPSGSAVWGS
jgi:hypothetical protein